MKYNDTDIIIKMLIIGVVLKQNDIIKSYIDFIINELIIIIIDSNIILIIVLTLNTSNFKTDMVILIDNHTIHIINSGKTNNLKIIFCNPFLIWDTL